MTDETFSFRWGVSLLDAGHTSIPNVIIDHYALASVSRPEFLVIIHLARFQFESPHAECRPSVGRVARAMGYTDKRGLQKILSTLEERGLLTRHYRTGDTTIYNFSGFSRAVLAAAARDELEFTPHTVRDEPEFTGGDEPGFRGAMNQSSSKEEKEEKESEQEYDTAFDDDVRAWIAELVNQPTPERPTGRTTEEILEGVRAAEAGWIRRLQDKPHLTWAADCEEAQRALASLDGHGNQVRWLGAEIERVFRLAPDWAKPKKVRHWITSLYDCLKAAKYNPDLVIDAGKRLRKDECTLAGPWSFENTARAIAAEREAGDAGHESDSGDRRWSDGAIRDANAAAADALGEPG